jgi:preprotein translocase subunit SecF
LVELFRGRKWDLVGLRNYWFAISIATIAVGLYFLITNDIKYGSPLTLGIDFTSGGQLTYQVEQPFATQQQTRELAAIRHGVDQLHIETEIQIAGPAIGAKDQILFRTKTSTTESAKMHSEIQGQAAAILEFLEQRYPGVKLISTEMVGPVISRELINNAILAVVVGMLLVLVWIMIRYDIKFATTAIIALVHDILVLLGVFAILHKEINSPFVAVVLTVVGYSVHDTVVIFDRIRENLRLHKGATFAETTNISLLETMARSVNTVLTVLFTVLALYFLGGATLRDFALGLVVGITSGAYSSIFNASQLLAVWKEREERRRRPAGVRAPVAPRPTPVSPARPTAQQAGAQERVGPASAPAPLERPAPSSSGAASTRKKKKAGKRKRRY